MPIKAAFQNYRILEAFTFRRTLGVTPDVCQIQVAVPKSPKTGPGDLVISDGRSTLRIKEMTPIRWQKTSGEAGILELADTRVTWPFKPCLFGEHNKPYEDGMPVRETRLDALAKLCLANLGIVKYDLGALKSFDYYPHTKWEWERPADALARLLSLVGCDLALHSDNSVEVVQIGVGTVPKGNRYHHKTDGVAFDLSPRRWLVRGGRTLVEETVDGLIPVGLDVDGSVKPIASLSYAPIGGFVNDYTKFPDGESNAGKAAIQSVWKWYQLPSAHLYKLPLLTERLTTVTEVGIKKRLPPLVQTKQANNLDHTMSESAVWANGAAYVDVATGDYTLDCKRGIVQFNDPVFKVATGAVGKPKGAEGTWEAANVQLTFAYESVQADGAFDDSELYTFERGEGDDYTLIERPDLVKHLIGGIDQNQDELDTLAKELIRIRQKVHAAPKSGEHTIIGIADVRLNGLVRSVAFSVSAAGGVTTALSLSTEQPLPQILKDRDTGML